jgi:hypothetical protein
VHLALDGPRADRTPPDRVGDVLRRNRVEELTADREAELEHLHEQLTGGPQTAVHVAGAVEVRVVDQALPAQGRARLLEVHAHHHEQTVGESLGGRSETFGVLEGRLRVVHRARTDDDQQAVVDPVQYVGDRLATVHHGPDQCVTQRELVVQGLRRDQRDGLLDPSIDHGRLTGLLREGIHEGDLSAG